ncbi:flagellar basal body-associated protein FliL [Colwellia sp. UCD-KL20]|uniref:flagellar basal body-associated protein FliL n=1 Tax=Colwellia sp. UCD-KL20 TaxID=1917165 RepID=UPI00097118F6|nr:flagellar basal body-associated protein FliL [Colwellia sp. UCD-KL20]
MADGKEEELELDNAGGGKKKMIIIIAAVVILIAGGAGAFFFMSGGDEPTAAEVEAALDSGDSGDSMPEASSATAEIGTAIYVPMPRPFRFNVPGAARDRFVEIRAQLLVRGGDAEETAKKHIPLIESTLLAVFSQSNADDLATSAGKVSLKQKTLSEIQKVLMDIEGNKIVEEVLFTGFVMQ